MSHKHHGHHGHQQDSSSYNYGAPVYEYNPLQQSVPPYGQVGPYNGYGAPGGNPYGQGNSAYGAGYGGQSMTPYQGGYSGNQGQEMQYLQAEEQRHRQNEHRAEMGALGAVAFAAVSMIFFADVFSWNLLSLFEDALPDGRDAYYTLLLTSIWTAQRSTSYRDTVICFNEDCTGQLLRL